MWTLWILIKNTLKSKKKLQLNPQFLLTHSNFHFFLITLIYHVPQKVLYTPCSGGADNL